MTARFPSLTSGNRPGNRQDRYVIKRMRLALLVAALQLAGGAGIAYVAGFSAVRGLFGSFQWPWLLAVVASLVISLMGYYYACRGIYRVEGGPKTSARQMRAIVVAGFGGFLIRGGGSLDKYALRAAGADDREAKVRVSSLAGMEHGILSIGGCGAAIAVLAAGYRVPPMDFSVPWAVIPVPGFLIAVWSAERYRERFQGRQGWRGKLGIFLDSIHLVRALFIHPRRHGRALIGMGVFWTADFFAAWAGLAAFGFHMNGAKFIVGAATGMVFTRRMGPLGGAGILELVLPLTIWASGAPLAVAVVGTFAYRGLCVWLPMPFAISQLSVLREMSDEPSAPPDSLSEMPAEARREGDPAIGQLALADRTR